jgi:tetratricopeptide (TPR) repeat protein
MNLQDWAMERFGPWPPVTVRAVALGQFSRVLTLLGILIVGGMMFYREVDPQLVNQAPGRERALGVINPRGALGWSLFEDASLRESSRQLAHWQEEQKFPGRVFHLDWREMPAYAAWFAPGARTFMDSRFQLHGRTAQQYFDVYTPLRETGGDQGSKASRDERWQKVFRELDISCLAISDRIMVDRTVPQQPGQKYRVNLLDLLLQERDAHGQRQWEQLDYTDGRTFLLAWTGSPHWKELQRLQYDADREAFRAALRSPPPEGPRVAAGSSKFGAWLGGEVARQPLGCDEAQWHVIRVEGDLREAVSQRTSGLFMPLVMVPGMAGQGAVIPPLPFIRPLTAAPSILAVRAARRAIAENPTHADSWFQLSTAYRSWQDLESYVIAGGTQLRQMQILASLRQAALLDPLTARYQFDLASLYFERGVLDLAKLYLDRGTAAALQVHGTTAEQLQQAVLSVPEMRSWRLLFENRAELENSLRERKARFNSRIQSFGNVRPGPEAIAEIAGQEQLLEEARLALEQIVSFRPASSTSNAALKQLLALYVEIGYLQEALRLLQLPNVIERIGADEYHLRRAQIAALAGNYVEAIRQRRALDELLQLSSVQQALAGVRYETLGGISSPPGKSILGLQMFHQGLAISASRAALWNDAGMIALEAGWTTEAPEGLPTAPECFRRTVAEILPQSPYSPLARRYYWLTTGSWLEYEPSLDGTSHE